MKRLVTVLVILLICSVLSASSFTTIGISSNNILDLTLLPFGIVLNTDLRLGFGASGGFAYDFNKTLGVGVGFGVDGLCNYDDHWRMDAGNVYLGPCLHVTPSEKLASTFTLGLALVADDYLYDDGDLIGGAFDASVAYFFGDHYGIGGGYTIYFTGEGCAYRFRIGLGTRSKNKQSYH